MDIIISGCGKFGKTLTRNLAKENHNVLVVDNDPQVVEDIVNSYDVMGYCGNIASYNTQKEIEISKYDLLISTTSTDEINILACLTAKKNGVTETCARVRNPDYSFQSKKMSEDLGVSLMLNPDLDTASEIFRILRFPSAIKVEPFANGKVDLVEIKVENGSLLANKSLFEIKTKLSVQILICVVQRGDSVIIPKGDFVIKEGDYLYIAADSRHISTSFKKLKIFKDKLKSTLIIGGGKVAYYLASLLIKNGIKVKIIDNIAENCNKLANLLPQALIIYGDGTSQKLLREEGMEDCDSVITLTGVDETNIVVSTFAKSLGVDKVITKVNNSNYNLILEKVGLDCIVSPKEIFANEIIRYARSMESTRDSECKTLYRLVDNKVEAMEFVISKKTSYTSIPLKDLKLKNDNLICCIIRDDEVIIPSGKDTMEPGDSVVIITKNTNLRGIGDIVE